MNKEAIASTNAPPAIGPHSPGIKLGDALFLSGQLGIDSATGKLPKRVGSHRKQPQKKAIDNNKLLKKLFIKYIRHLFPAVVTGTVIFTIGLSLYPIAIRWMAGGMGTPLWGTPRAWLIAIITLVAVFVLGNYGKGILSLGSLLFGIVIGTIVSLPFGMLDLSAVGDSAWVAMPEIVHFQLEFQPAAMATVAIVYVVNCLQNMGGVAMTVNAVEGRIPTADEYAGGIISLGIMSILGAFVGAIPQSTYEQNTDIIISNGAKNRLVFTFACLVFIVAGFLPKFAAVLTCIPQPVVGGAVLGVFATITMSGLDLIVEGGLTARKKLIAGTAIALGLGIEQVSGCLAGAGMPEWVGTVFGSSALVVSTITAILLNICLPKGEENLEEARVEAQMSGSVGED